MLRSITIKGLFNQFSYKIDLKDEGITILTGPNGYGKTTILNIIYAFAIKNLIYFFQLPFDQIIFTEPEKEFILKKTDPNIIQIQAGNKPPETIHRKDILKEIKLQFEDGIYRQLDEDRWQDRRTGIRFSTEFLTTQLLENNPDFFLTKTGKKIPDIGKTYLIREQRLLRKTFNSRRRPELSFFGDENRAYFSSTIEEYANELSGNLKEILAQASKIGQELDSTFPRRLFDETSEISEEKFNRRYDSIRKKQTTLSRFGLSTMKEDRHTSFKPENSKALLVYLNDTERKLAVFDNILQKLQIFSSILNERKFAYKNFKISPENGFQFTTEKNNKLSLTNLSSGEQQEVVLLYELLFKVNSDTLVLIDEPEISLHVAWQKEFLNDLLKIIKLQPINIVTATHSPQIIDVHWDLVVDLEEISE